MEQKLPLLPPFESGAKDKEARTIKIALADDHILLRDALAGVVNGFEDCEITILASHGKELQSKIKPGQPPDLVILDLNMPEMDGYETVIMIVFFSKCGTADTTSWLSALSLIKIVLGALKDST